LKVTNPKKRPVRDDNNSILSIALNLIYHTGFIYKMHVICPKQKVWNTKEDEHKTQKNPDGFPLTALEVLCPI